MKLTRSPGVSYLWMALAVLTVAALFARWEWFNNHGHQRLWWELLAAFLVADYLFLIIPIQDHKSVRYLSTAGKLWAAVAWICCVAYVVVISRRITPITSNQITIVQLGSLGFLLLVVLVLSVYRLSHEWIRESLRSIVARVGGGFLVRFAADPVDGPKVVQSLQAIPGAQPLDTVNEWSVPADPGAASALLQLAKKYDFDFVPTKTNFEEKLLSGR
jgi:hypothetical protein